MRDGTDRNHPDPTYTCAVRMERKWEYINEKKSMKEGRSEQKKKRKKKDVDKKEESEKKEKELR